MSHEQLAHCSKLCVWASLGSCCAHPGGLKAGRGSQNEPRGPNWGGRGEKRAKCWAIRGDQGGLWRRKGGPEGGRVVRGGGREGRGRAVQRRIGESEGRSREKGKRSPRGEWEGLSGGWGDGQSHPLLPPLLPPFPHHNPPSSSPLPHSLSLLPPPTHTCTHTHPPLK